MNSKKLKLTLSDEEGVVMAIWEIVPGSDPYLEDLKTNCDEIIYLEDNDDYSIGEMVLHEIKQYFS